MNIVFMVKSKKEIHEKEGFKKSIKEKITEIIHDHYYWKIGEDTEFEFEVLVEEINEDRALDLVER